MNLKSNIPILFFCLMSLSGMAQINKHSFGAQVMNGFAHVPANQLVGSSAANLNNPDKYPYLFGIGGSYVNSTKKWLSWRTNLNLMVSSRYENYPESFEGLVSRTSQRDFTAELGFGPMFTYQKDDYGIYIGGTLDLIYFAGHERNLSSQDDGNMQFAEFPLPSPSLYLGYWQRIGNVNSPWFLELSLMRRHVFGLFTLFVDERSSIFYTFNLGFRYELKN